MEAAEGREAFYNDDYDRDEEPDGQLLLEIIRKEEDRDLRELVSLRLSSSICTTWLLRTGLCVVIDINGQQTLLAGETFSRSMPPSFRCVQDRAAGLE